MFQKTFFESTKEVGIFSVPKKKTGIFRVLSFASAQINKCGMVEYFKLFFYNIFYQNQR